MVDCPQCCSSHLESHEKPVPRVDDQCGAKVIKYKCLDCGCEFEVTERWEIETEIIKDGDPSKGAVIENEDEEDAEDS